MTISNDLLSQAELCRRWKKSPKTIRRWTALGLLPTFTDPDTGTVLYPWPACQRWLAGFEPASRAS